MRKGMTYMTEPFRNDRFKALVAETGATQGEVGEQLDIVGPSVCLLTKAGKPSQQLLRKIAEQFGCPVSYLTGKTDNRWNPMPRLQSPRRSRRAPVGTVIQDQHNQEMLAHA